MRPGWERFIRIPYFVRDARLYLSLTSYFVLPTRIRERGSQYNTSPAEQPGANRINKMSGPMPPSRQRELGVCMAINIEPVCFPNDFQRILHKVAN